MPDIPPIDDLENLSATGAMLEGVLRDWVKEITECAAPNIPTLAEAIDFFARLAAIRKTLIKLSRLPKTPNGPPPSTGANQISVSGLRTDPVSLPAPDLAQIPSLADVPYDRIRPQLETLANGLAQVHTHGILSADPSVPSAPSVPSVPSAPSVPSVPSAPSAPSPAEPPAVPPIPRDPRCVALNIHPLVGDTSGFPDNHPFFDRSLYTPTSTSPWHRKKPRRFG